VVTITAESDEYSDGVRMTIPVLRYETPEVVATAGSVPENSVTEAIRLPAAATENGQLQLRLEPSLAAGMIQGLDYAIEEEERRANRRDRGADHGASPLRVPSTQSAHLLPDA
jgi:hypothetical protein